jgi:hypothetical protein
LWKDIEECPGYKVSDRGRLIGLRGHVLIPGKCGRDRGYRTLKTSKGDFYVHRLVAKYFIGAPESGMQVNHINGNKSDNRLENLEWCTPSENIRHAVKLGVWVHKGVPNNLHNAKTDKKTADTIRVMYWDGVPQIEIAKNTGLSKSVVNNICKYRSWI